VRPCTSPLGLGGIPFSSAERTDARAREQRANGTGNAHHEFDVRRTFGTMDGAIPALRSGAGARHGGGPASDGRHGHFAVRLGWRALGNGDLVGSLLRHCIHRSTGFGPE
jgi:hypothetical protein